MDAAFGGAYSDEIIYIIDVNTPVSINQAWNVGENMLIRVNGGARLTLNAAVTLSGALQVYNGAELNICAALTNEAYGNVAGVERGLCVFAGGHGNACIPRQICGRWARGACTAHGRLLPCGNGSGAERGAFTGANTVHVSQDAIVAVNGAVSIPRGVTLKLLSGARLSIADGALLINTGAIELSETAALHISHGAQYIRGGEEKFSGTVTGLDPQLRLFNTTTARQSACSPKQARSTPSFVRMPCGCLKICGYAMR